MCPKNLKCAAYFTLVRPHLKYSACAWDYYLMGQKYKIAKVQKKAARFVENNYCKETGTVTRLLEDFGWPTLETSRKCMHLVMFHKIIINEIEHETSTICYGAEKGDKEKVRSFKELYPSSTAFRLLQIFFLYHNNS